MTSIRMSGRRWIAILINLFLAIAVCTIPAKAYDFSESRIDAIDRFDMKLSDLTIDADQIQFALNLSGNGVESEEECLESYRDGVREGESGDDRLCRTVRQEFSFFNGVIPEDAAVIKTTFIFNDDNFFQIHPPKMFQGPPAPYWTKGGFKWNVSFYNPNEIEIVNDTEETTEFMIRGYPTKENFGIYLSAIRWGINQFAVAMTYRMDYFHPKLAYPPLLSASDDFSRDGSGFPIVDGKFGAEGSPTIAQMIEAGELDVIPDDPITDRKVVYAYNDPFFGNGSAYNETLKEPIRVDTVLTMPAVWITYRTAQGGIGNWIGKIDRRYRIQYTGELK